VHADKEDIYSFLFPRVNSLMSNAPFKIAFWVMSLAFGLTVLLTGLKPEEIRSALNPKLRIQQEELAHQEFFLEDDSFEHDFPAAEIKSITADDSFLKSSNSVEAPSGLRPIRVASADINGSLGLTNETSPIEPDRFSFASEEPQSATAQVPHEKEIQILVPDPVKAYGDRFQPSVADDVAQLKKKILRLRLANAHREFEDLRRENEQQEVERVETELDRLREQIADLKKQRLEVQEAVTSSVEEQPPLPELIIPDSITPEPMPVALTEPDHVIYQVDGPESRIEVSEGVKVENADIHDVLKTLAAQAGWNVVIRSDVEGTFSGSFEDAVPDQAFATVIKLQNFGISLRGDYVLVRARKDSQIH